MNLLANLFVCLFVNYHFYFIVDFRINVFINCFVDFILNYFVDCVVIFYFGLLILLYFVPAQAPRKIHLMLFSFAHPRQCAA